MTEDDIQKMGSLKSMFQGSSFQWVKSPKPELMGKIVKCVDISYAGPDLFFAMFDDGSKVITKHLNTNLMMLGEGVEPMPLAAIQGINQDEHLTKKMDSTIVAKDIATKLGKEAASDFIDTRQTQTQNSEFDYLIPSDSNTSTTNKSTVSAAKVKPAALFGTFKTSRRPLNLKIEVDLPSKSLLKMMFDNTKDKDQFISDLSQYVLNELNSKLIEEAVSSLFITKSRGSTVSTTEIVPYKNKETAKPKKKSKVHE